MRAGLYLRISMDRSGEQEGVERQAQDCHALADQLGWQIAETYRDNDTSASSSAPRPQYRRMLADIAAGRIDAIIAWHTDRLYRRPLDLEDLIPLVETHRVLIRTCRAGELDLSTPTGQMLARILGATARHEVDQKADRWKRSVRQRREAGRWVNAANRLYGYTRDGAVVADEAAVVNRMAADILSGAAIRTVCRWLQAEGIHTTRGNSWQPSTLKQLLRSPRIAGLSVLNGVVIGDGGWEPILDRRTWELVCAALDGRHGRRRDTGTRRSLLGGIAVCGHETGGQVCGRRLYRSVRGGYPVYVCRTETQTLGHVAISATPVEQMAESYARARLADPRVRAEVAARLSGAGAAMAEITREIDGIEAQMRDTEAGMSAVGARAQAAALRVIDDLDTQLGAARARLAALSPVALPREGQWPTDIERRSALIRLVVARMVVSPASRRGGRFDRSRVRIDPE